ncbi:GDSL-motif lipase/hydrolase family protein [Heracleum sosnowskyi]|uniref:GDSL-motif lipase/hydrolase family protein n=1 Tax=Heracleum sosnowskyi TaxID=360622 RepID=A0AAD8HY11_9APIA|nr:GDSL-motif lipase/hydrolase family protein [Heracleum sosnowskyi]
MSTVTIIIMKTSIVTLVGMRFIYSTSHEVLGFLKEFFDILKIEDYIMTDAEGAIFLPTLFEKNVISLSQQLEYFKQYKGKLEAKIGKERTKYVITNALFIVCAGTNDFIVNYYTVPIRRRSYDLHAYMDFLLKQVHQFMEDLLEEGARRIGVPGMTPIGCLPIVITLYSSNPITNRTCIESLSSVAKDYNIRLQKELYSLQLNHSKSGSRIAYLDSYTLMQDIVTSSSKFGFEVSDRGCCGTGMMEAAFICNRGSVICSNTSNYVFWDSIHPTERVYYLAVKAFRRTLDFIINR